MQKLIQGVQQLIRERHEEYAQQNGAGQAHDAARAIAKRGK
jgi:hypothetical protein